MEALASWGVIVPVNWLSETSSTCAQECIIVKHSVLLLVLGSAVWTLSRSVESQPTKTWRANDACANQTLTPKQIDAAITHLVMHFTLHTR